MIEVTARRGPQRLAVVVADDGAGLPEGFDLDSSASLGLQIVRTLVVAELGGRLEFLPRPGGGTEVLVDLPMEMTQALPEARSTWRGSTQAEARGSGRTG
jgi:two-component sensor histidine kinase